jgi:hypothetical protein
MRGLRGFLFNTLLSGLMLLLSQYLTSVNIDNNNYTLPLHVVLLFAILLPFEHKANLYIISIEFAKMTVTQQHVWKKFSGSWLFGIIILMALIWRTYFKIHFLLLPIWKEGIKVFELEVSLGIWVIKIPLYIMAAFIIYSEGMLIGHTLNPKVVKQNNRKEWISKIIILISMTFFTTGILEIFGKEFQSIGNNNILSHLPFATIVFFFFYIPVRYVEIIADTIDCQSNWQLWLFWTSNFLSMVVMFLF